MRSARLPDPVVSEKDRGALEALAKLLLLAATQLTRLFNQHGECDHVEIAGAARRALTEDSSPTPLAERIGTRLMHILVDEFQDTSRDQYDLLRTLTQDWSPGDGRTLFLVGDPMQSIYGFRNAEVGRFSTVRAAGLDGLPLTTLELRRNFRSAPALVHWCNDVFSRVFPAADDVRKSAVRHLASVAARTNLSGEPRIYRVEGDCGKQAEAEHAADLIAELKRTKPTESIAVLAGARPHLRAIRECLEKRAVPFIGVKLEPLADVSVVRDLEALVRAIDSPLDRVAWLAVLRAPFVGLGACRSHGGQRSRGRGLDPVGVARRHTRPLARRSPEAAARDAAAAGRVAGARTRAARADGRTNLAGARRRIGCSRGRARACTPVPRGARRSRTASACAAASSISTASWDACTRKIPRSPMRSRS